MNKKEENRVRFLIDKCDATEKIMFDSGLITKLQKELILAMRLKFVKKPIAYALYQTWKYFDKEERER